ESRPAVPRERYWSLRFARRRQTLVGAERRHAAGGRPRSGRASARRRSDRGNLRAWRLGDGHHTSARDESRTARQRFAFLRREAESLEARRRAGQLSSIRGPSRRDSERAERSDLHLLSEGTGEGESYTHSDRCERQTHSRHGWNGESGNQSRHVGFGRLQPTSGRAWWRISPAWRRGSDNGGRRISRDPPDRRKATYAEGADSSRQRRRALKE